MAGNYLDVPGHRMALDRDGSQAVAIGNSGGAIVQLTQNNLRDLGDESDAGYVMPSAFNGYTGKGQLVFFFPELRHVSGYWGWSQVATINWSYIDLTGVDVSSNSTNGVDGTWQPLTTLGWNRGVSVRPLYRQSIVGVDADNVRAIRFTVVPYGDRWDGDVQLNMHLYGFAMPGQATNRLGVWHPSVDQQISGSALDWGDTPAGSSATRTFRVKNLSAGLTAIAPFLGFDTLTDPAPSVLSQYTLSLDGSYFTPQVTLPDLAPGEISSVVTVRRNTPADAALSVWALRLIASATSWSSP